MQEIFDLQMKLNIYTLKNIGLDFYAVMKDPEQKPVWIENYRKALSAELAELIREVEQFGIGTKNGQVEIVDMLHFLISLSQIAQLEPSDVSLSVPGLDGTSFPSVAIRTFLALDDLQSSVKWKWWAKGGGYNLTKAREALLCLWRCLGETCAIFGLDFNRLKEIYIAKNQVNFLRQDQDYNEDTKTEDDNLALRL
jgi:dimeric dUTPase (all-alpha-NTP-PPase superfamily)